MDDPDTTAVEGAAVGDVVHIFINGAEASETKAGTIIVVAGGSTEVNITLPDTTGPTTSNVQADGNAPLDMPQGTASVTLTAAITDVGSGGKNIKAAEYFVGTVGTAGSGTAMTASDGSFNSATENVTATVDTSSFTTTGSPYTISVRGQDVNDNWGATQTVQVTVYEAPEAPVLIPVTSPTRDKTPTVSWNAVTGAATYDLQVATDEAFTNVVETQTGLTATSFTAPSDVDDDTYYWRVRAVDAGSHAGAYSAASSFIIDTTGPAAVTGLAATAQATGNIQLGWTNPAADFAGVIVLAKTDSAPALTPVDGTAYTAGSNDVVMVGDIANYDDVLSHNTHRYYTVFAYDSLYNYSTGVAADQTSADSQAPSAPTGFAASPGDQKVTLAWTNPTDTDFGGVIVLYKQGSAPTGIPVAATTYNTGDTIGDATVGYKGSAQTTQIAGLTNNQAYHFAIYAYDERPNYSTAAAANATPVPFGITVPAALTVDVKVGQEVALTAAGPSGTFEWTATGGTLSATTGASVTWTAPDEVTTSPTAYTITVADGENAALTDTRTVNVYSGVSITNKPTTTPTIQPGESSAAFNVSGGDPTAYTWTVKDRAGTTIGTPQTGSTFTFTAPDTGAFAGEYTITVTDNLGLSTDSFKVKVPFTLTPSTKTFLQNAPQAFTVAGAASTYTWEILAEDTLAVVTDPSTEYGAWQKASPVTNDATNTFTPATGLTEPIGFYLQVTITGDANLTEANGLNEGVFGPFRIIPVAQYTVKVTTASGTAIVGAEVEVDYNNLPAQTTNANGEVVFTLPATGGKYMYDVSKAGYANKFVFDAGNPVEIKLETVASSITGTVDDGTNPVADADVVAYLPASPITRYETMTAANGTYTINIPTGAATSGWSVVAAKTGYTSAQQTGQSSSATVNLTLTAIVGTAPDVDAGGGSKTSGSVTVEAPAGGVQTEGYVIITPTAKDPAATTPMSGSPTYVYDVKVTSDAAGTTPLAAADIGLIVITLPIDLRVVKPGDLENNVFTIYSASTQAELEAGNGTAVPVGNIINTDYVGDGITGSVTFWVDHLSVFGIGAGTGLSGSGEPGEGCFIATAAYGSYFEKHVQILRDFRDAYLKPTRMGQAFVEFYYRHSPSVAALIAKHNTLRAAVRLGLAPVVGFSYVTLHTTPVEKVIILMLMIGLLSAGLLAVRRFRRTC
ncbi:MAG: carboxypeptidase regulatory-like domain-containing protein [Deltaproteobacteria bacterium]|nr:carboxypeptidase regulatory-like domain-containing protein [Deltaproteobacteria bacterium]